MTSTNHVMTGAVIALVVTQPALAIPLAFASHFVLDTIPHFGILEDNRLARNQHWLFKTVTRIDIPLMLTALILVPILASGKAAAWVIFCSMLAAILPDAAWLPQFVKETKTKQLHTSGKFGTFHQAIQWYEHPTGLALELVWLAGAVAIIERIPK